MKALITGGAGFLGGHLAVALTGMGAEVVVVDRHRPASDDPILGGLLDDGSIRLVEGDLLTPDALDSLPTDCTHIFHLAARLGVQSVLEEPYATLTDNVALLVPIIDLARRQRRLERLLFTSTSEVYAGALLHLDLPLPTPEDTPLALPDLAEPRTSYMLSKLYGEALIRHCGLPWTIVRPHNVYGPRMGMRHVIPQLMERALRTEPGGELEVFSADHRRAFCYVDDAVAMLIAVSKCDGAVSQLLNLGAQGPEVTMAAVAECIIQTVGTPLTVRPGTTHPGSPTRRIPDMTRMTSLTGVQASVSLQVGVSQTWRWYRRYVFDAT